jgi:hypothetical protein
MDPATDWVASGGRLTLDFDGSNDFVDNIGSLGSYNFIQNDLVFTLSWWQKMTSTTTRMRPLGNESATASRGFQVICEFGAGAGTAALRFAAVKGVTGTPVIDVRTADNTLTADWQHCAIIGDGSAVHIYLNSLPMALTTIAAFSGLSTGLSTRVLRIGTANFPSLLTPFFGALDDMLIYSASMTENEIREIYRLGRGFGVYPEFDFDEAEFSAPTGFQPYWARQRSAIIGGGLV